MAARVRLSELLRHLVAGQITNDEFEDRGPGDSGDPAIREVRYAAWFLYDDLREYRLAGQDKLPDDVRSDVARWVLFLHSDLEYEYPLHGPLASLAFVVANLLTLGMLGRLWRRQFRDKQDLWPFFRREDLAAAISRPVLLI